DIKNTIVPNYVTQSGYTENIPGRPVVGVEQPKFETFIYNRTQDTVYAVQIDQVPGITDIPKFYKNYPKERDSLKDSDYQRAVYISRPYWNKKGTRAFIVIRA